MKMETLIEKIRNTGINPDYLDGVLSEYGICCIQSYRSAFNSYMSASSKGSFDACYKIGTFFELGLDRDIDIEKATEWYSKCLPSNHPLATYRLGLIYEKYEQFGKTFADYWELYSKSAIQGNYLAISALIRLNSSYEHPQRLIQFAKKVMHEDNPDATELTYVGLMFEHGIGGKKFISETAKRFIQSDKLDQNSSASLFLGRMYEHSIGFSYSYEDSWKNIKKSALNGNMFAQTLAAEKYGFDTQEWTEKSLFYYFTASCQGNPDAMNNLAVIISDGLYLKKSDIISYNLIKNAADLGNVFATHNLGLMYLSGIGTERFFSRAHQLFEKSTTGGLSVSSQLLKLIDDLSTNKSILDEYSFRLLFSEDGFYSKMLFNKPVNPIKYDFFFDKAVSLFEDGKIDDSAEFLIKAYSTAYTDEQKALTTMLLGFICDYLNRKKDSRNWYNKSKDFGNSNFECKLAWIFYDGSFSESDNASAISRRLFQTAANNGIGEDYYGLACLSFDEGEIDNASRYEMKAAKLGYSGPEIVHSQYQSSTTDTKSDNISPDGSNIVSNDATYAKLYNAALKGEKSSFDELYTLSNQNNGTACYYMGKMMELMGSNKTYTQAACDYYDKATRNGHPLAESRRHTIGRRLNKEDTCPRCGSELVIRPGRYGGYFKGCSRYPSCRYTTNVSTYICSVPYSTKQLYSDYCNKRSNFRL